MIAPLLAQIMLIAAILGGCAALPPGADLPKTQSLALDRPELTRLGRRFAAPMRDHPGKSALHLLPVGVDGFLTRVQMINVAEHTIDLQYFIFHEDHTGALLNDVLLRAADRGVRVRVLLDDLEGSEREAQIAALDAHANIEIRLFNPFNYRGPMKFLRQANFLFAASRLDYRMHNKLFVVGNAVALVGGRNVGDEYFQVGSTLRVGDYDVFAAGPVVKQLSASFDTFWNAALSIPVATLEGKDSSQSALDAYRRVLEQHRKKVLDTDYVRRLASGEPLAGMLSGRLPLVWASAQVVSDSPSKKRAAANQPADTLRLPPLADALAAVRSELLIVSPYFVPGREGMRLIEELRKRDVRVRVLTNSLASTEDSLHLLAHAAYARYRLPLLDRGVEIYEMRPRLGKAKGSGDAKAGEAAYALHAKALVFDRRKLFIGSMNFDQRSMHINTEMGLLIDSPELAQQSAERFASLVLPANSYALRLRSDDVGGQPRLVWRSEENGRPVETDAEVARSAAQRFKFGLFSLLPFDGEL